MRPMFFRLLLGSFAITLLVACTGGESNVVSGNRDGIFHYGNGSEPQGLDPHVVTGVPENHILRALFEGLAVKNPYTLEPEPGVASSWDISDDGRVITFHINPEAVWSNGEPMTAADYVWSWQRLLTPVLGAEYAYMLFPVKNAEAFNKGEVTDFSEVGVKALDDSTLQVTLNERTPYFLQLMDHYSTFAVHRPTIEKLGKATDRFTAWTRVENMVSNGAFRLKEWQLNRRIELDKSDTYWDRDKVRLNGVVFYPTENVVSEERMFRVGQLHYTGSVPLGKIPVYQEMENSPYVQAPYLGTYYYLLNTKRAPTGQPQRAQGPVNRGRSRQAEQNSTARAPTCPPTVLRRLIPWVTSPRNCSVMTWPMRVNCWQKRVTPTAKAGRAWSSPTTPAMTIARSPWRCSRCGRTT